MTVIGVTCPKCKQFSTEIYDDYEKKLEEFYEDVKVREVMHRLEGRTRFEAMYIPIPIFYCEGCGVVIESSNLQPRNRTTVTKVDKWRDRYGS